MVPALSRSAICRQARRGRARRLTGAAALVALFLTAGCGSAVKNAIASRSASPGVSTSAAPSPSATATPSPTGPATPTPTATPTLQPSTHQVTLAPTHPASSPAASSGSGTGLIWLWVLLGVVALVGAIALLAHWGRRRSSAAAAWQSKVIDAYAKGSALYDAMSVAETPDGLVAADAVARWYDVQRRADDLMQVLYGLRETAPDEAGRAVVAGVIASLQAARSAMDAERVPGGAGMQHAEVVHGRLLSFEDSLRSLRALSRN